MHNNAWTYLWNRKRVASFAIIAISFISLLQSSSSASSWQINDQDFLRRYYCLNERVPRGEKIGYLSTTDGSKIMFRPEFNYQAYFQINHALAPIVISNDPNADWIIVDLPDEEIGLETIANVYNQDYLIIHNCENGLFIIHRSEKE